MVVRKRGHAFTWLSVILTIIGTSAGLALVAPSMANAKSRTTPAGTKSHKPQPTPSPTTTTTTPTPTTTVAPPAAVDLLNS